MFTGIIESLGKVIARRQEQGNVHFCIDSELAHALKIDQSIAHNGVCLTVTKLDQDCYWVTAIEESLRKSNLGDLQEGSDVNLERCMMMGGRLDGHIVQGHVDQTAICTSAKEDNGSWLFTFQYNSALGNVTVEKGSICINGVSLTCFDSKADEFTVAIIPYTYEHTTFKSLKEGDRVNLEFDIIGKYVQRMMGLGNGTR